MGGAPAAVTELVSFDGSTRCREQVSRPDRYRHLEAVPAAQVRSVRGGGYSYVAASFGGGGLVQDVRAFDRLLDFDPGTGVLRCEAGASLGQVLDFALARGFYLPVTPGYPRITIGGCIAADVHGKNQFADGNFSRHVRALTLFHPATGFVAAGPRARSDLFELTCGGFGLTGQIVTADLALTPLPSRRVRIRRTPIARLEDTREQLEQAAREATFVYTWHDLTAGGDARGRGFLFSGTFAPGEGGEGSTTLVPIDAARRGRRWPAFFGTRRTRVFNAAYGLAQRLGPGEQEVGIRDILFPVSRRVAYFHLFGARGLHEAQVLFPSAAWTDVARALLRRLAAEPAPVTLASAKLFRGRPRHLRFDGDGVCLAVDVPRDRAGLRFLEWFDGLARDHGGRPNLVKDSRLSLAMVGATVPGAEEFRQALAAFDPGRIYRSELSRRLEL